MVVRRVSIVSTVTSVHNRQRGCPGSVFLCDGGSACGHAPVHDANDNVAFNSSMEEGNDTSDDVIIQGLHHKVTLSKEHVDNYLALSSYLLFTVLYLTILYLQADSLKSYQVSSAHKTLYPDDFDDSSGYSFPSVDGVYDWLNNSIIQTVWKDPICGNGVCEQPFEYPSFERFGCLADCGKMKNVSEVIVSFILSIPTDAKDTTTWNLCMESPSSMCLFEENSPFSSLLGTFQKSYFIPDGNWSLVLDAPLGGVVGKVTYNGTYMWNSPDAIKRGSILTNWDSCEAPDSSALGKCRNTSAVMASCAIDSCSLFGTPINTTLKKSEFFVDLLNLCNADFGSLNAFEGLTCAQIRDSINLTRNSSAGFGSVTCETSSVSGSARKLKGVEKENSMSTFLGERRMTLADPIVYNYTEVLWNSLGENDSDRLFKLRVATQRAVYTWVAQECLAEAPVNTSSTSVARFTAFFCTFFGGPTTLAGCQYTSASTKKLLTTDAELAAEMRRIHSRLNLTGAQLQVFTEVMILALQSVTELQNDVTGVFFLRMESLVTDVVRGVSEGCPNVAFELSWSTGQIYDGSRLYVGDAVRWIWTDDDPHSVEFYYAFGKADNDSLSGMGTGELIVTRKTPCNPLNIGSGNISEPPVPCVLSASGFREDQFSITYYLQKAGNFSFRDGRNPLTTYGSLVVTERPNFTDSSNRGPVPAGYEECAPECPITLLRNGKCENPCNNAACAYDGGDCSCPLNIYGVRTCTCPEGQVPYRDGSCCESYGVGDGLRFGFSISTWGSSVRESDSVILGLDPTSTVRYVGNHNRVLIGMSISQTRYKTEDCKEKKFLSLIQKCTEDTSHQNFGVNPVFLPTSSLYDDGFKNASDYYGNFSVIYNDDELLNSQGIPFGFQYLNLSGVKSPFQYIIDVNFNNKQAAQALQYFKDGHFLDNATKHADVAIVTYNGLAQKFSLLSAHLSFVKEGQIQAMFDVQSVSAGPYNSRLDWFRFFLEILFALAVAFNIFAEVKDYIRTYRREGTFYAHYTYFWNVVDFISLAINLTTIVIWARYAINLANPFMIDSKYDTYKIHAMDEPGQFWSIISPGKEYVEALTAFSRVRALAYFRTYYTALNGISILFIVLRILKLMDFQPRMGTITRTIGAAFPDLVHFFILFFVIFFGFSMYGHLVFGRFLSEFRTLAASLVTCFSAMLGNDSVNDYLVQLQGWELASAIIFWWSFIVIMTFIIFNILIAIIVEAFMKIRELTEDAPSMPTEVAWIINDRIQRLFSKLKTDGQLLKELQRMGATKEAQLQMERVEWLEKSQRSGSEIFEDESTVVMDINGSEFTLEALEAIFQRVLHGMEGVDVSPASIAKAIFEQNKRNIVAETSDELENNNGVGIAVNNCTEELQRIKADMLNLTEVVKTMVNKYPTTEVPQN